MKRKIILGLVSIVLCVSMVGCGATSTDAPSSSSSSTSATETSTNAPTEAPQEHVNTETNDKEFENDEEESSVITFDEMLDSMVAEYGEVEFIPVFAERNFEDTIAYLETQLRPTEHTIISVNVSKSGEIFSYTTSSGEFARTQTVGRYVPMTYDGEYLYVTYPKVLVMGTATPYDGIPAYVSYVPGETIKSRAHFHMDGSGRASMTTGLLDGYNGVSGPEPTYPGDTWGYGFGKNVCHFVYDGESYVFLYDTTDTNVYEGWDIAYTIYDACRGIVLKDTEYTKDKTVSFPDDYYIGYDY